MLARQLEGSPETRNFASGIQPVYPQTLSCRVVVDNREGDGFREIPLEGAPVPPVVAKSFPSVNSAR